MTRFELNRGDPLGRLTVYREDGDREEALREMREVIRLDYPERPMTDDDCANVVVTIIDHLDGATP